MNFSEYRKCLTRRQEILTKTLAFVSFIVVLIEAGRLSPYLNIFGGIISPTMFFLFFCLIPIVLLINSRRFTVNYMLMLFCIAGAASLVFNQPVTNYMSSLRFFLFCGMLCLLSPLVDSAPLRQFRQYLWQYAIYLCQLLVILSIFAYLWTLAFTGKGSPFIIIGHPMLLSTLAAIVSIVITWRLLNREKNINKKNIDKYVIAFNIFSLVAAILLMIWGGARSAIISFILAEIYLFTTLLHRRKGMRWLPVTIIATLAAIVLIGGDTTYRVKKKFEIAIEHDSLIFSRQQLWKSRIDEFKDSPVIGIGFTNATYYSTLYDNKKIIDSCPDRREEPGSSWLCVLSNTGVIGFAILALWNIGLLRVIRTRRRNGDTTAAKYGALLIFLIVEGFFEGWILYAGSFIFLLYWLLTSRITDYKWLYHNSNQSICEKCLGV